MIVGQYTVLEAGYGRLGMVRHAGLGLDGQAKLG